MIDPVRVKVSGVHIPDLSAVNEKYWTFKWNEHTIEGLGYVCPPCGRTQIVKSFVVNEQPTWSN